MPRTRCAPEICSAISVNPDVKLDRDLTNPAAIWVKGWLFLLLAVLASLGLLVLNPRWDAAALLAIALWAAARWYYFMFYVIEKYVDPSFKFAGLGSFVRYALRTRRGGA